MGLDGAERRGPARTPKSVLFLYMAGGFPGRSRKGARAWSRCYVERWMRSLLVAALLLGAAARAETGYTIDGSAVRLTDGAASLAVAPRLVLDVRDGESAKPRERVLAPAVWRASAT